MAVTLVEKRNYPRIKSNIPLHYNIRGKPEANNTLTNNISLGGISFSNEQFIPPKTPLMLEIHLYSRIVTAIGDVCWSNPYPHSDRYQLGIQFSELLPQEKNILSEYINRQVTNRRVGKNYKERER